MENVHSFHHHRNLRCRICSLHNVSEVYALLVRPLPKKHSIESSMQEMTLHVTNSRKTNQTNKRKTRLIPKIQTILKSDIKYEQNIKFIKNSYCVIQGSDSSNLQIEIS